VRAKITVKFAFAATQSILALSTLVLAGLLGFNVFNISSALNIPAQALGFYVAMLTIFGVTFLISGVFLIYDWWET